MGTDRAVTIMVDLTRDQAGCLQARLLDAVVGRSGTVYRRWLDAQPEGFVEATMNKPNGTAVASTERTNAGRTLRGRAKNTPVSSPTASALVNTRITSTELTTSVEAKMPRVA